MLATIPARVPYLFPTVANNALLTVERDQRNLLMTTPLFQLCQAMVPATIEAEGFLKPGQEMAGITRNGVDKLVMMGWIPPSRLDEYHKAITATRGSAITWCPWILFAHGYIGFKRFPKVWKACTNYGDVAFMIDCFWQMGHGHPEAEFMAALAGRDPLMNTPLANSFGYRARMKRRIALRNNFRNWRPKLL